MERGKVLVRHAEGFRAVDRKFFGPRMHKHGSRDGVPVVDDLGAIAVSIQKGPGSTAAALPYAPDSQGAEIVFLFLAIGAIQRGDNEVHAGVSPAILDALRGGFLIIP